MFKRSIYVIRLKHILSTQSLGDHAPQRWMEDPLNDAVMVLEHVQLIHYIQFLGLTNE